MVIGCPQIVRAVLWREAGSRWLDGMTRHQRRPGGFTRGPRVADQMTSEYLSFVESSTAAERAGDAEAALEYHRGVPMFARGAHAHQLTQLAGVADEMTPWVWARWAAYQATRAEDLVSRGTPIVRRALQYAVSVFHGDDMQRVYDDGADPVRLTARVFGEDWAFHQVCTYELGALEAFLDQLATGRLAQQAGLAREWVGTRMGGYRLESAGPPVLGVRDLATDRVIELLDLGAHVHADDGGWLIGRVVPSGGHPALMFDTRPLPVDETTARQVAEDTGKRAGWAQPLAQACREDRVDRSLLRSEDRELITDVPSLDLVEVATSPAALARTLDALHDGRDEIGRAAFRILRSVAEGTWGDDRRAAYVGAAVVNAHASAEAGRKLASSSPEWQRWAALVPEPAKSRLLRLGRQGVADVA